MHKRVLVTGRGGQLGKSIQQLVSAQPHFTFVFVGRETLDLSTPQSMTNYFTNNHFDMIINCAAYTAVDHAESEPKLADQINHLAPKQLAQIAKDNDMFLIHISSDYVFNGQNHKPYIETDSTDPQSAYGVSKLKGEQAIRQINPKGAIIRTSWLYSQYGHNFVKTMIKLGRDREALNVIFDQVGTPTYASDLAQAILEIANHYLNAEESASNNNIQLYHYSNEGVCSWYDFSKTIFSLSNIGCQVTPIETKDYPTPAKRPHYSLMNKAKIKNEFTLQIPYWKDSLKTCLRILETQLWAAPLP